MHLYCTQCDAHVEILGTVATIGEVQAWCCTRHASPVEMVVDVEGRSAKEGG